VPNIRRAQARKASALSHHDSASSGAAKWWRDWFHPIVDRRYPANVELHGRHVVARQAMRRSYVRMAKREGVRQRRVLENAVRL